MNAGGDRDRDTICAVSTPPGFGGIAVIRVSGAQAIQHTRALANFLPHNPESHRIYFGELKAFAAKDPVTIDEVLVSVFHQGRSFTGEETIEISCHGSPAITQWILQELIAQGCRPADRGEFSYRAFMNGKIDLIQAEGILQLVESQSKISAKQGLRQLQGGLSDQFQKIEADIIWVMANIEASIDFSTEDLDVINRAEMIARLVQAEQQLQGLAASYEKGRLLVSGLKIVLSGLPNVGKSSLFNFLLGESRAIVTDLPGTTRDLVEAALLIDGIRINMVDTAGIRDSQDPIERIGIEKTKQSQVLADLNFFIFDVNAGLGLEDLEILKHLPRKNLYLFGNKIDQRLGMTEALHASVREGLMDGKIFINSDALESFMKERVFFISTFMDKYRESVKELVSLHLQASAFEDTALLSQARHFDNVTRALKRVSQAKLALQQSMDAEFVALDLKEALMAVQETLGKRFDDQVMDLVFRQFCIGK
jgi:tRNA modification GTPase